ncbi:FRG domain-containing protein [Vibrio sp. Y2-5]|uniref:FRG domain-containing protein n=1 Tax=Vibrio sp. Y2-5 TaxID=2743977 RepID=UPI001660BA48|nr:FRG domain-containing protein [Vibrio sp. Y2-5]MBD0787217.1 FRG domain-containing protein [Vibrio sp. Y2-5]
MKVIEHNLWGRSFCPSKVSDILAATQEHRPKSRNVYLWRGQGNADWLIHSGAYRRLSLKNSHVTESNMQRYEMSLLARAEHQGYRFENGRRLSDFELLAKLQHHGAATRLIDCSRNMLVALWFACSSEPEKDGLLFGIHSDLLGGGEAKSELRTYKEIFDKLPIFTHPQTWEPPVVTKRIAAQSAQFLYSRVVDNKFGSLAIESEEDDYIAFVIKAKNKQKILEQLSGTFDVRYLTLFPDLDGFGHANSFRFEQYDYARW